MLLHIHKKTGMLLPVGGHIELDQSPWQAALDEIHQESGYRASQLSVLQPKQRVMGLEGVDLHPQSIAANTHRVHDGHFHSDTSYALITDQLPMDPLAEGETGEVLWFTKPEIDALTNKEIYDNTKTICDFVFDVTMHWEPVPADSFNH